MSDSVSRKKKHRSPSYPSLDLKEAIAKIAIVYQEEMRHPVPVFVVAEHGGYSDFKSSSALRLIAAYKQFGLVVEEGSGDDRKVRVSDLALDILLDGDDEAKRSAAIKKAALLPPIYRKIWQNFNGNIPSDGTLRSYLIRELDFNDGVVDGLIRKFRSTVSFAELASSDIISSSVDESGDEQEPEEVERAMTITAPERFTTNPGTQSTVQTSSHLPSGNVIQYAPVVSDALNGPTVKFDLPRGNLVEIRLRQKLTKGEFEKLKKIFELSELAFVEDELNTDDL